MSGRMRETAPALVSGGAEAANEAGRRMLKGIHPDFASDDAAEAWLKANRPNLPAKGTGKNGSITVADVKTAATKKEA